MNRFTFYTQEKVAQARLAYRQLVISGSEDGDRFFEAYCPGNTINIADRPFERFEDYEMLLSTIKNDDPNKYDEIHKGSPFYFLAWTAFDLKNYEKAVFYMDAAILEDIRKDPIDWLNNPASQFLTLNHKGNQAAVRITSHLKEKTEKEILRFNNISEEPEIYLNDFVNKFVKTLVKKKENHSIITALYSFLLEFDDRQRELILRSKDGGSIEPVLTYLFKGGLIFESLLKYLYPKKDNGTDKCKTLRDIFNTTNFKNDFSNGIQIGANALQEIVDITGNDIIAAFSITGKLRNTVGHNLVWDDVFNNPNNFVKLFEQQINAVLYLIQKKFL
jgi:hypothetical protein